MTRFAARPLPDDLAAAKKAVLDAAFRIHRAVGPGFRETTYRKLLAHDLTSEGHDVREEVWYGVEYRGLRIDHARRVDLLVMDQIIVEVKAVEAIAPLHRAQIVSYLRATGKPLGLLLNFNVVLLRDGYDWYRHPDWLIPIADSGIRGVGNGSDQTNDVEPGLAPNPKVPDPAPGAEGRPR